MNRPLFFTVIMFALGEVTYMIAEESTRGGIFFCMLLCCAFFIYNFKGNRIRWLIYSIAFVIGFIRALCFLEQPMMKYLYYGEPCLESLYEQNYNISYYKNHRGKQALCEGVGIVTDVSEGNTGCNLTVKIFQGYVSVPGCIIQNRCGRNCCCA